MQERNKKQTKDSNHKYRIPTTIRYTVGILFFTLWFINLLIDINISYTQSNFYLFVISHIIQIWLVIFATFPDIIIGHLSKWIHESN